MDNFDRVGEEWYFETVPFTTSNHRMTAIKKVAAKSLREIGEHEYKIKSQRKLKKKIQLLTLKIRTLRNLETRHAIYETLLLMSKLESFKLGRHESRIRRRLVRSLHFLLQRIKLKHFVWVDDIYHRLQEEIRLMKRSRKKTRWSKMTTDFMCDVLKIIYLRISTLVMCRPCPTADTAAGPEVSTACRGAPPQESPRQAAIAAN